MAYKIEFRRKVHKELQKIPRRDQKKIVLAINLLAENPLPPNSKKLTGYDNLYRIRVGNWRIAYAIQNEKLVIFIVRIAHRKDIYRQQF